MGDTSSSTRQVSTGGDDDDDDDGSRNSEQQGITVIGMGQLSTNRDAAEPDQLQQVTLNFVPNDECESYIGPMNFEHIIRDEMICVPGGDWSVGFRGACNGDPGGQPKKDLMEIIKKERTTM